MFEVLRKSLSTGIVTTCYPATRPEISSRARGKPEIDWPKWKDARPAAAICPTGAISYEDRQGQHDGPEHDGEVNYAGLRNLCDGLPHFQGASEK